jgi:hypothetical protein
MSCFGTAASFWRVPCDGGISNADPDSLNEIVIGDDAAIVELDVRKRFALEPKTVCTVSAAR